MSKNYPVDPQSGLRDKGTKGVMATGAGLGLMGVNALLGIPVIGWILSGGLVLLGAMGLLGKGSSRTDKLSGTMALVAGGAGLATIFLPGMSRVLLGTGGLGLFIFGLWNVFQFARGIRKQGS